MNWASFVNDFITLFVAIDPLGTVPLLVSMLSGFSPGEQKQIVSRAVIIATVVLSCFALFGHVILSSMGVSFAAFRIAGGIVLFIVGAKMLFEDAETAHKQGHKEQGRDIAVFPLALPYLAGPATTLAVMVATQQESFRWDVLGLKILVLGVVMLLTWVILMSAKDIQRLIGRTGSQVIGRVMGILLAALAAESVVQGVKDAFGA